MGCSGSKSKLKAGKPSQKKFDDNQLLKQKGVRPLSKPALKAFNTLWVEICDTIFGDVAL